MQMSISNVRRVFLPFIAATACLAALLIVVPQAQATTYYACVKKGGSAHIFTKKPKCKRGESKLSWNNVGPKGINGTNGLNGTNGTNGAKGEAGAPGGFFGVLPS